MSDRLISRHLNYKLRLDGPSTAALVVILLTGAPGDFVTHDIGGRDGGGVVGTDTLIFLFC